MKLHNTPDRQLVSLDLPTDKAVKIYTCGPTVYDYPHIGNWYTFIRYDLLSRVLRASGYQTDWVMNVTDVGHLVSDADDGEDKLEKGAKREGKTAWDVAAFYTDYFLDGMKRLNFSEVNHLPKATDFIPQQIALVQKLEEKGFTYQISDGIYFDTRKFPRYADFAHLNLSEQEEGARVEVNEAKKNPSDFALWKFSPTDHQRDMEWDSPWGKGFPGWHLECSAMIHEILGDPIDIHAGGIDHIPVHHTNEVAQTEAAFDVPLSRYWMHCNHITVNGKKMAKSDGTFITLEDIEAKGFSLDVFRLHVLSGHYRSQSEFNWEALEATKNRFQNWKTTAERRWQPFDIDTHNDSGLIESSTEELLEALRDDLDTPEAFAIIDRCFSGIEIYFSDREVQALTDFLKLVDSVFGLELLDSTPDIGKEDHEILEKRNAARNAKNWELSDKLRDELSDRGIEVKDTEIGQIWLRRV